MSVRVCALASGSSANALLIGVEESHLLVDAGLSFRETKRRLADVGCSPAHIDAIFVTHEHSDHIGGLGPVARGLGVPVYMNEATYSQCESTVGKLPAVEMFETGGTVQHGPFSVTSFVVSHDAADPVGFCVSVNGLKIGVTTDLGYVSGLVKQRLKGCDVLVLECNHDNAMLVTGSYPWELKQRIQSRHGHLSNDEAASLLRDVAHDELRAVMPAHLSKENNVPNLARSIVLEQLKRLGLGHVELVMTYRDRPSAVLELP